MQIILPRRGLPIPQLPEPIDAAFRDVYQFLSAVLLRADVVLRSPPPEPPTDPLELIVWTPSKASLSHLVQLHGAARQSYDTARLPLAAAYNRLPHSLPPRLGPAYGDSTHGLAFDIAWKLERSLAHADVRADEATPRYPDRLNRRPVPEWTAAYWQAMRQNFACEVHPWLPLNGDELATQMIREAVAAVELMRPPPRATVPASPGENGGGESKVDDSARRAWQAFTRAQQHDPGIGQKDAWKWVRDNPGDEYDAEHPFPNMYTFTRYLRTAKHHYCGPVNHSRRGRNGRNIVRHSDA